MFWMKCDKALINQTGALINCGECPCGYYALFVFVVYSYNQQTGKVNYCYQSIVPQAQEVIDNKVFFSGWSAPRCIEVSRTPDPEGKVGYVKSCLDCWMECVEWDEEWNCIREEEFCMDCSEIFVYRLSGCFDKYNDFAAYFYGGCGVEPDEQGNYPAIFEPDYWGHKVMTMAANSCVSSYWQGVAEKRYRPNCTVNIDILSWDFNIYPYAQQCEVITHCENYCEGTCYEYDESGCIDCEGIIHQECWDDCGRVLNEAMYITHHGGRYFYIGGSSSWDPQCNNGQGCWVYNAPDCCEYWSGSRNALAAINEYDLQGKTDRTKFDYETTMVGPFPGSWGTMCWGTEYEAYYGCYIGEVCGQFWHYIRCGKLTVARTANTPSDAIGVKMLVTAYSYKTNDNEAIIKDQYTYLYNETWVDFIFDEETELPIVDNMNQYYIYNEQICDEECVWGNGPEYRPNGWHSQTERFSISLTAFKYIFAPLQQED